MSALCQMLSDMLFDAETLKKQPITKKLRNGLRISVFNDLSCTVLTIARDDAYPSLVEWNTVLQHYPYHVARVEPDKFLLPDGWHGLRGRVEKMTSSQLSLI